MADTVLYPAHLMIGGWRLFFAFIIISLIAGCQIAYLFYTNIQQYGFMHTWFEAARIAGNAPFFALFAMLIFIVPIALLMLPLTTGFTGLLFILRNKIFGRGPRKSGLLSVAQLIQKGCDPNDFVFEQINGVFYGRRRGA